MSNNKLTSTFLLLFIGGILSGAIIGSVGTYYWQKVKAEKNPEVTSNINEGGQNTISSTFLYAEPEKKYQQSGQITKIEQGKIYLTGQIVANGELKDDNFTVLLNEQTIYKKFNLSLKDDLGENITSNDLKENDNITVLTDEDIKNKNEFTAKQINLYINN